MMQILKQNTKISKKSAGNLTNNRFQFEYGNKTYQ